MTGRTFFFLALIVVGCFARSCTVADDCSGNAAKVSGQWPACACECANQWDKDDCSHCPLPFTGQLCDECKTGWFDYGNGCPACTEADVVGTCNGRAVKYLSVNGVCGCQCGSLYAGDHCEECSWNAIGYPNCEECTKKDSCSDHATEVKASNNRAECICNCRNDWSGSACDTCPTTYNVNDPSDDCGQCLWQYVNYTAGADPKCTYCGGHPELTILKTCSDHEVSVDSNDAHDQCVCNCKPGFGGDACEQCAEGWIGYPNCRECTDSGDCNGNAASVTSNTNRDQCLCTCEPGFDADKMCAACLPTYVSANRACVKCDDQAYCHGLGKATLTGATCTCKCDTYLGDRCDVLPTDAPPSLAPTAAPPTNPPATSAPPTGVPATGAPPTGAPPTDGPLTGAPPTTPPTTIVPSSAAPQTGAPRSAAPPPTSAPTASPASNETAPAPSQPADPPLKATKAGATLTSTTGSVGGTAAAAAGLAGSGASASLGRLLIVANLDCAVSDVDLAAAQPLDFEYHPLGFGVGGGLQSFFLGAALANPFIVAGFLGVSIAFATVRKLYVRDADWAAHLAAARFPSFGYIPVLFLIQGTSLAASNLVFFPGRGPVDGVVLGLLILLACAGVPVLLWTHVLRPAKFNAVAVVDPRLCDEGSVALSGWKREIYTFLFGTEVWITRDDPATALFVERFGLIFEQFRFGLQWFAIAELVTAVSLSLLAAWTPSKGAGCLLRNSMICLLFCGLFGLLWHFVPYQSRLDNSTAKILTGSMCLAMISSTIALQLSAGSAAQGGLLDFSAWLLVASAFVLIGKTLYDVCLAVADLVLGRKRRARSKTGRNLRGFLHELHRRSSYDSDTYHSFPPSPKPERTFKSCPVSHDSSNADADDMLSFDLSYRHLQWTNTFPRPSESASPAPSPTPISNAVLIRCNLLPAQSEPPRLPELHRHSSYDSDTYHSFPPSPKPERAFKSCPVSHDSSNADADDTLSFDLSCRHLQWTNTFPCPSESASPAPSPNTRFSPAAISSAQSV
ncbi:Laminin subunit alpha [Diplonema papillatum]|nr:Laminin subunit alpha [Diplonema papillatum]